MQFLFFCLFVLFFGICAKLTACSCISVFNREKANKRISPKVFPLKDKTNKQEKPLHTKKSKFKPGNMAKKQKVKF